MNYIKAKCADFCTFYGDRDVQDAALYACALVGVVLAIVTAVQS